MVHPSVQCCTKMTGPLDNFQVVKWHNVDFYQYCRTITARQRFNIGTLLIPMLKQQAKLISRILILLDGIVLSASFLLAFSCLGIDEIFSQFRHHSWILIIVLPVWFLLIERFGLYASIRTASLPQIISSLLKAHIIAGILTAALIFLIEPLDNNRALFGYFISISFLLLAFERLVTKIVLHILRKKGRNIRYILIVGTDERARDFIKLIEYYAQWGLKIAGLVTLSEHTRISPVEGYRILGSLDKLVDVCKQNTIDEVVFCVSIELLPHLEDHVRDMEEMGITTRMVLDFYELQSSRREIGLFHGEVPVLTFHSRAFDASQLFLKRILDIVGAIVGLTLTAFLFPFLALAIKYESPGPLFFGQKRVGKRGRIFTCWKFRSMTADAEKRKKDLMHLNELNGAVFKITNDPRVTRIGAFIRKASIDELPQFWNVLKGEMSLVGTRPPTPDEVANYENWQRKRICINPGITGLWQVSGRNQIQDFDEIARLDIKYIENWSLWLDIRILFKTIWVVFARKGSC